ncbi:unnamed protein product [Rotaria sordida]|uniref:mitogen-activated protein kinase kinase n=1 Tax=Rotaria sordida TaxID=392033 RepID=A0A814CZN9_9BILA|nr:unnamed protein product [Rotaria sordida]CAF0983188.1 unnamed protein product [Rotaria sordida]CAF0991082.1 unnamed protein product [Rotaria sordida]
MPRKESAALGKNILGLTLEVPKESVEHNHSENGIPDVCIERLQEEFKQLDCTDKQKDRMEEFFNSKRAIGELKHDDLVNICELGQGNGGIVWKVRHKPTDKIMARKYCSFINTDYNWCNWCHWFWNSLSPGKSIYLEVKPAVKNQIVRELKVLHQCNSPYIVGFYGTFAAEGQINICMEYMDGGSLDLILKKVMRIPEHILGKITVAVLRGLSYLRERHRIMHRDIKPSNILVNHQGEIKLCDFGVSAQLIDSTLQTFIGTRSYMSPERLEGANYGIMSDIWSLGLSLVEMALGRYPIPPPSTKDIDDLFKQDPNGNQPRPEGFGCYKVLAIFELMEWIVNEAPPSLSQTHFSPEFCDFIDRCLKKSTTERADLNTLLHHPFYKRYESESDNQDVASWIRQICKIDQYQINENNYRRCAT